LVVSVFFLALHVRVLPFADNTDNWLQGVALVSLCILYFVGLIMKASLDPDLENPGSSFDPVLQVLSITIVVVAFATPLYLKAKFWYRGLDKSRAPLSLQLQDMGVSSRLSSALLSPLEEENRDEGYELMRDDDSDDRSRTPEQLQAELRAMKDRFQKERQERRCEQEERRCEQEERRCEQEGYVAMQSQLQQERKERRCEQEERRCEQEGYVAMQSQFRHLQGQLREQAEEHETSHHALADPAVVAANVPAGRGFFDTQQSTGLRAADSSALVGKAIEVGGRTGVVRAVVAKAGSSTLHTVDFGGGRAETVQLAKRAGGKGAKFHLAGEGGAGANGGGGGS
jgi:hypothetical protein